MENGFAKTRKILKTAQVTLLHDLYDRGYRFDFSKIGSTEHRIMLAARNKDGADIMQKRALKVIDDRGKATAQLLEIINFNRQNLVAASALKRGAAAALPDEKGLWHFRELDADEVVNAVRHLGGYMDFLGKSISFYHQVWDNVRKAEKRFEG